MLQSLAFLTIRGKVVATKAKWFKPSNKHSHWSKTDPAHLRRYRALKAHKGNLLSTARSLQALANVTRDATTRKLAQSDARYFYVQYEKKSKK